MSANIGIGCNGLKGAKILAQLSGASAKKIKSFMKFLTGLSLPAK